MNVKLKQRKKSEDLWMRVQAQIHTHTETPKHNESSWSDRVTKLLK